MRSLWMMLVTFVASSAIAGSLISGDDRIHINTALDSMLMTSADAGFEKDIGKPAWTLGWITNTLNDPWRLPGVAEQLHAAARAGGAEALMPLIAAQMEIRPMNSTRSVEARLSNLDIPPELDENIVRAVQEFYRSLFEAAALIDRASAALTPDEKKYVATFALSSVFETEDHEENRAALVEAGLTREMQERVEADGHQLDGTAVSLAWLDQLKKIDFALLLESFRAVQGAAEFLRREDMSTWNWPAKPIVIETSLGAVMVGSTNADYYASPALLILDPGGNDRYADRAGVANGLTGPSIAAVVDRGGDDVFRSNGLLAPGSALWGVAVLLDSAGNDIHEASFVGGGAAILGAAWQEDFAGVDDYKAHAIGQGAATAGFGLQIDEAGNDRYEVGFYGQGFSGVMGWGLLLDREGHDTYLAGNVSLDHERNEARFLSLAQGFSIGMRPHAGGGMGALIDLAGNDRYIADVYGQGVSYYYSAGILIDEAGQDVYSMYQYGQGCGIHLSLGLLADLDGNDSYSGYILSQGSAHDYAVGMLVDHAGNDTYTGDHHTQGRALNNAFALLLDRAGDDGYFARQRDEAQGIGNSGGFRDYGSLALLVDLGGADVYSGGFSNQTITLRPLYGVVYDHEND